MYRRSPFVFGGTAPIDPRVLSGLTGVVPGQGGDNRPQRREEEDEDLGGLY